MNPIVQKIRTSYIIGKKTVAEIAKEFNLDKEVIEEALGDLKQKPQSNIEKNVGLVLRELYPQYRVLEQKNIGGLFLDYYVEQIRLGIEVDGIQHSESNAFFHGKTQYTRESNFEHQLSNDKKKEKLLKEQHIYLIRINYNEEITNEHIKHVLRKHSEQILDNLNRFTAENRVFK